jgi:hypothetical protein
MDGPGPVGLRVVGPPSCFDLCFRRYCMHRRSCLFVWFEKRSERNANRKTPRHERRVHGLRRAQCNTPEGLPRCRVGAFLD